MSTRTEHFTTGSTEPSTIATTIATTTTDPSIAKELIQTMHIGHGISAIGIIASIPWIAAGGPISTISAIVLIIGTGALIGGIWPRINRIRAGRA